MLFDPGITSKHRRRSSNVNASSRKSYKSSSCFVHALLEAQRAAEAGKSICEVDEQLHKNEELGPNPGIASRTLTKVQLTDLALGVRELSKRFGTSDFLHGLRCHLMRSGSQHGDTDEGQDLLLAH